MNLSRFTLSQKSIRIGFGLALAGLILAIGWWDLHHLDGFHWDTDEGTALMQVRMLQEGYALYRDVWSDHPPGLMLSILAAFRLVGSSVAVGRAVVVGYALLGLLAVALIVRRINGRLGALAAVALLASTPNFFWLSRSVSRDIPAVCLATLALAFGFCYMDTGRRRWLVAAGVVFALGLWVKLIVVILLPPLALMVLLRHRGSPRPWRGLVGDLALLALAVGLTLLPIPLLFDPGLFFAQVLGTPWQARGAWPSRTFEYVIWMWEYLGQENLGLSALAAYGLVTLAWRRSRAGLVIGFWLLLTIVALLTHRPLWAKHHFSLLLFPVACLAGIGVDGLIGLPSRRIALGLGLIALAIYVWRLPATLALDGELLAPHPFLSAQQAVQFLQERTAPGDFVVTDVPMIAFRSERSIPPWVVVASSKRIQTGQLTDEELIAVSEQYRPRAVLLWDDHLIRLTDYIGWMRRHYYLARRDGKRQIWVWFDPAADVLNPRPADLDGQVSLLGYAVDRTELRPGDTLHLTLTWRAQREMAEGHNVFAHLLDEEGHLWGQHDGPPQQGDYPTNLWAAGEPVPDEHPIVVSPDAPPGTYTLSVGLYDWQSGQRLPAYSPDGARLEEDRIILGQVQVLPLQKVTRDEGP